MNKKILHGIILLGIIVFISGCITSTSHMPVVPKFIKSESFQIGSEQVTTVGEVMISRLDAHVYPGYRAIQEFQVVDPIGWTYPTVRQGDKWYAIGTTDTGDYVCRASDRWKALTRGDWEYLLVINANGVVVGAGKVNSSMGFNLTYDRPYFEAEDVYRAGSFKQEIIYNGKSKDTIKLQYREYSDNLARPAYTQDLIYDMTESKSIGFRGMVIDIVSATNSTIAFIVRSTMKK